MLAKSWLIKSQRSGISKPVVWGTRGLHHFRGFRDFRESSTQLLLCSCLSCLCRFRRFREKFILARTREKKKTFPHLKFSFSIENFNPRPWFSAAREGPGMKNHSRLKIAFRIERLIFSRSPLEIELFQFWGPLGAQSWLDVG